jgi:hypothetical protein
LSLTLAALLSLLTLLAACHGVDPLLANPPPPTRPDAVLRTPPELQADLAQAARDEAAVRAVLAQPLWGDALSQPTEAFRAALAARRPELAPQAEALQASLGALFTRAATLGSATRQLSVRLQAMEQVRQQTGFVAYVAQRAELFNRRAEALRAAQRAGGAAATQAMEVERQRAIRDSGKVERIDYVKQLGSCGGLEIHPGARREAARPACCCPLPMRRRANRPSAPPPRANRPNAWPG